MGAVALTQTTLVVVEVDVEDPMEAVFDTPMGADRLGRPRCGEEGGGDVIARFGARAVGEFSAGLDTDDRGGSREAMLAWKAPVAAQPIDVMKHADGTLLDAAVTLVVINAKLATARLATLNAASVSARSVGWLALTASR